MEEKRRGHEDDYVQTILFTAGTVLVMACIKQSVAVCLMEQYWRAWVFVVLNLVLLAIVFTSLHSPSSKNQEEPSTAETNALKKSRNKQCSSSSAEAEEKEQCYNRFYDKARVGNEEEKRYFGDEETSTWTNKSEEDKVIEENNQEVPRSMSPEELNERVEAFITMFRQQLVNDERKGREHLFHRPEVAGEFNFHRVSYSCSKTESVFRSRRADRRKVM